MNEQLLASKSSTNALTSIVFIGLLIGTGFMQTSLKSQPQIYLIILGFVALASLFADKFFKIPIPFYILLGIVLYVNIFIITNFVADVLNPNDGWVIDSQGKKRRVMSMNWVWGILTGFVFSWLLVIFYHKKLPKNRTLEIVFVVVFILVTSIIYHIQNIA